MTLCCMRVHGSPERDDVACCTLFLHGDSIACRGATRRRRGGDARSFSIFQSVPAVLERRRVVFLLHQRKAGVAAAHPTHAACTFRTWNSARPQPTAYTNGRIPTYSAIGTIVTVGALKVVPPQDDRAPVLDSAVSQCVALRDVCCRSHAICCKLHAACRLLHVVY